MTVRKWMVSLGVLCVSLAASAFERPPYEYYPYVGEPGDRPQVNYTKVCLPGEHGEKSASYVALGIFYPRRMQAVSAGFDGELVIPEEIDGLPVRRIMPGAFLGCTKLKSVKIPSSVREIGERAFAWCLSLERIEIAEGTQAIGDFAFSNCVKLVSVELPSTLASVGGGCFARCNALTDVTFKGNAPRLPSAPRTHEACLGEKYFLGNDAVPRFRIHVRKGTLGWLRPYSPEIPERWPVDFGYDVSYEVIAE